MKNTEALELLKHGGKVKLSGSNSKNFYQAYADDHIYELSPASRCSATIVAVHSPEQFLHTSDVDFVVVDEE